MKAASFWETNIAPAFMRCSVASFSLNGCPVQCSGYSNEYPTLESRNRAKPAAGGGSTEAFNPGLFAGFAPEFAFGFVAAFAPGLTGEFVIDLLATLGLLFEAS